MYCTSIAVRKPHESNCARYVCKNKCMVQTDEYTCMLCVCLVPKKMYTQSGLRTKKHALQKKTIQTKQRQ